jgi:hypothetical protein
VRRVAKRPGLSLFALTGRSGAVSLEQMRGRRCQLFIVEREDAFQMTLVLLGYPRRAAHTCFCRYLLAVLKAVLLDGKDASLRQRSGVTDSPGLACVARTLRTPRSFEATPTFGGPAPDTPLPSVKPSDQRSQRSRLNQQTEDDNEVRHPDEHVTAMKIGQRQRERN